MFSFEFSWNTVEHTLRCAACRPWLTTPQQPPAVMDSFIPNVVLTRMAAGYCGIKSKRKEVVRVPGPKRIACREMRGRGKIKEMILETTLMEGFDRNMMLSCGVWVHPENPVCSYLANRQSVTPATRR